MCDIQELPRGVCPSACKIAALAGGTKPRVQIRVTRVPKFTLCWCEILHSVWTVAHWHTLARIGT